MGRVRHSKRVGKETAVAVAFRLCCATKECTEGCRLFSKTVDESCQTPNR